MTVKDTTRRVAEMKTMELLNLMAPNLVTPEVVKRTLEAQRNLPLNDKGQPSKPIGQVLDELYPELKERLAPIKQRAFGFQAEVRRFAIANGWAAPSEYAFPRAPEGKQLEPAQQALAELMGRGGLTGLTDKESLAVRQSARHGIGEHLKTFSSLGVISRNSDIAAFARSIGAVQPRTAPAPQ